MHWLQGRVLIIKEQILDRYEGELSFHEEFLSRINQELDRTQLLFFQVNKPLRKASWELQSTGWFL